MLGASDCYARAAMKAVLSSFLSMLGSCLQSRASMQIEILALRHQLTVLQRQKKRVSLGAADRLLWVLLSRIWNQWRSALVVVKPETVIAWHRKGFRLYWRWKSRAGKCGRPCVSRETRDLIRQMSKANPLWGAPRIHGELLKLGIEVSQATVAKYMSRQGRPPSQTWRTFLENHVQADRSNRLSGSEDCELSLVVCICGGGSSSTSRRSLQRDGTADR